MAIAHQAQCHSACRALLTTPGCPLALRAGKQHIFERTVREHFGNNPDTSKALRILVCQGRLTREGQGGRGDPFKWVASASRLAADMLTVCC
jgi:hypothetical protein